VSFHSLFFFYLHCSLLFWLFLCLLPTLTAVPFSFSLFPFPPTAPIPAPAALIAESALLFGRCIRPEAPNNAFPRLVALSPTY
jgi:hypothetical protein